MLYEIRPFRYNGSTGGGSVYTVYVVDDEPLVLSQFEKNIRWEDIPFQLAGMSTDPVAACQRILEMKPDVVLTDISMPVMSGLVLIRTLKERGLKALFVVISAYDRFEYARELLLMEGFDYLLKPLDQERVNALMERMYLKLNAKGGTERPETYSAELNRILKHMQQHFQEKQSLGSIGERFSITPTYICRLFSKHMNTTFSAYLQELRIKEACRLLKSTDLTIKEIAACCGYEDYFYFCRVFRGATNLSPTEYRSRA